MMTRAEIRRIARENLKGHWGLSLGLVFLIAVINGVVQSIPFIGLIAYFLVSLPLTYGTFLYFLRLGRKQDVSLETGFSGFQMFGRSMSVLFVKYLFMWLWIMPLFIIFLIAIFSSYESFATNPFILNSTDYAPRTDGGSYFFVVAAFLAMFSWALFIYYRFHFVERLALDYPEMGVREVIRKAQSLIHGHKKNLFLLDLSFIGWYLLCMAPFFILGAILGAGGETLGPAAAVVPVIALLAAIPGFVFVFAYQSTAATIFYDQVVPKGLFDPVMVAVPFASTTEVNESAPTSASDQVETTTFEKTSAGADEAVENKENH